MSSVQQALDIRVPIGVEGENALDGQTARRRLHGCFGVTKGITVTTILLHVCRDGSVSQVGELAPAMFHNPKNAIDYTRQCERDHGDVLFVVDATDGDVSNIKLPNKQH